MGAKKVVPAPEPDLKARARRISKALRREYSGAQTALIFGNPWQLLVATILSAQCTDERVNMVTPVLFAAYPDAPALAAADPADVERIILSTGFFRQKTKAIIGCARAVAERHGGRIPESMEELTALPGVGRKTAHVVRGNAYGYPAIFVDTHFRRLAGRMELSASADPEKIEAEIAGLLPEREWTHFSNAMIWHGRRVCVARKPRCPDCVVNQDCPTGRRLLGRDAAGGEGEPGDGEAGARGKGTGRGKMKK